MSSAGLRERRKATNRAAILDAATRVFTEMGYEASTVRDIVRASGLAAGTFYNYFQSKEDVLVCLVGDLSADVRLVVEKARRKATNAREFVFEGYLAFFRTLGSDRSILDMVSRNQALFRSMVFGAGLSSWTDSPTVDGNASQDAQPGSVARGVQGKPGPRPTQASENKGVDRSEHAAVAGILQDLKKDLGRAMDADILAPMDVHLTALALIGAGFEILLAMGKDPALGPDQAAQFLTALFLQGMAPR
ncbi:MAG: TetR/AcrR family transcriptional regulator [Leptospiraceae bacterium]|nr:TetR/AcrR family transcriptional regulator [Leptospiraceae bacterium]